LRSESGSVGEHDRHTREPLPEHISARPEDLPFADPAVALIELLPILSTRPPHEGARRGREEKGAMSSKKQLRRKRKQQRAEQRPGINPATAFILVVAVLVVLIGVVAVVKGGDPTPPREGAVWSAEHGHWH
jgi:hypothetical protein